VAACGILPAACQRGQNRTVLGSADETISDVDHGAAAAALDAMEVLAVDQAPDSEAHIEFGPGRAATADDSTRADLLLVRMRGSLGKYRDVRVAAADGFEELPGSEGKHTLHHLTNWSWARAAARSFDPVRPASLLYREASDGTLALVGAMFVAAQNATPADLDRRLPLGLARWHRHVNWCAPRSGGGAAWLSVQDSVPIYGPRSAIISPGACDTAGGTFYPHIFGWMAHVTITGSDDPSIVWSGALPAPADSALADAARSDSVAAPATRPAPAAGGAPPSFPRRMLSALAGRRAGQFKQSALRAEPPPTSEQTPSLSAEQSPVHAVARPPERPDPTIFSAGGHFSGTFASQRRQIAYERFIPPGGGIHPAILLLPNEGTGSAQAARFDDMATTLSGRGYVVEIVHYIDPTQPSPADQSQRAAHIAEWKAIVRDAISEADKGTAVDASRIGLFGTGLGATVALAVGAEDSRVRAVVEYEGWMPTWAVSAASRMPAVFIGQNDADSEAAVREANRIRAICTNLHAPVELAAYSTPNRARAGMSGRNLRQQTFNFFEHYLKGAAGLQ